MTNPPKSERLALRQERNRLLKERNALDLEEARLEQSRDSVALQALDDRLRRLTDDLEAYVVALQSFHRQFGPVGH